MSKTTVPSVPGGMTPTFPDDEQAADFKEMESMQDGGYALVPVDAPTHHLVVGMGTLAAMDDAEFEKNLAIMQKGQERIKVLMDKLLLKGEDYGTVKGIDRPFLHQPGAEKLSNFYGFAVEQKAERIIGVERPGWWDMSPDWRAEHSSERWLSPPLAYHVMSYVHLGDFTGPIVAMGYGEASSWEEKYRYRWAKATCPKCGREGLIKGKADGKLKGKWWCPSKEGGCNSTFEAADPQVAPPSKIDNPDPHSMAETLIQMAGKRSFVASIRRATGTSGLFTQDEDSPSVQAQVSGVAQDEPDPVVTAGPVREVAVGGKTSTPSAEQLARLPALAKEKGIKKETLVELFDRLFGLTVENSSTALTVAARALSADQLGQLLYTMDTGEVPDPSPAASPSPQPSTAPEAGATLPTGVQATPLGDMNTGDDKSIILEADGTPV